MNTLKRSNDRKVTNDVSPNGKTSRIANAFGLPSGVNFSCPGATSVCGKVCYAGKLEQIYSGVREALLHNWNLLKDASLYTQSDLLSGMIDDFRADCVKRNARMDFRIHWDGDFFNLQYAYAWARVIDANPDINFWVYTRSFFVLEAFVGLDNLHVYLSTDKDNVREAVKAKREFPFVNYASLADTFAEAKAMTPDDVKTYPCPELKGSLPLISPKGSACMRCGVCVTGRGNVTFAITKR